jgi:Agrobacterium tumefaciens protein Atu4866
MTSLNPPFSLLPGMLLALVVLSGAFRPATAQQGEPTAGSLLAGNTRNDPDFYVGLWVTADGYVRHELMPGGRYDEARGNKASAYRGAYRLSGDHIDYEDDTGFMADGEFRAGVLYHGGMVLFRERSR